MKFLSLLVIPNKNDMIMDVRNTHMASNNLKVKVLGNSVFIVNANKATLNIIADILVRIGYTLDNKYNTSVISFFEGKIG